MHARTSARALLLLAAGLMAGCANETLLGGNSVTTSAITPAPKVDPVCITLTTHIDTLRKDGVADKIEKAAAKKYKMTPADLTKANELNKANAEFQSKCSTIEPKPQSAQAPAAVTPPVATAAAAPPQAAAKAPPPAPQFVPAD